MFVFANFCFCGGPWCDRYRQKELPATSQKCQSTEVWKAVHIMLKMGKSVMKSTSGCTIASKAEIISVVCEILFSIEISKYVDFSLWGIFPQIDFFQKLVHCALEDPLQKLWHLELVQRCYRGPWPLKDPIGLGRWIGLWYRTFPTW